MSHNKRDRRQARILAVQALYQMELAGVSPIQAVRTAVRLLPAGDAAEPDLADATMTYAEELVEAATRQRGEVDDLIRAAGSQWRLDRMAPLDLQVLRVGVTELLANRADVPAPVSIDEAVEIAKAFGGDSSAGFVNGVLDAVARMLPARTTLPARRSAEGGEGGEGGEG